MDRWKATALVLSGVVFGMMYASACGMGAKAHDGGGETGGGESWDSAPPPSGETATARAVAYVDPRWQFVSGVASNDGCSTAVDGTHDDYSACCPAGFSAIGFNFQTSVEMVACLED